MGRTPQTSDRAILDEARRTFIELGPNVSTTVIAGRLGVSQATLFKRFPTKEELLIAALSPPADVPWIAFAKKGPDKRDIRTQLTEIAEHVLSYFKEMLPCMMVLMASGISEEEIFKQFDMPPPVKVELTMTAWFQSAMDRDLIRKTDAETLAVAFLGSVQSHVYLNHISARYGYSVHKEEAYREAVIELFLNGIKTGDQP